MEPAFALRFLKKKDQAALAGFFLSLKPPTLRLWNRFGNRFTPVSAFRVAAVQVNKPLREEQGFVVYDGERIIGYCYLRFFPEKPQKKGTASLGMVVGDGYQGCGIGTRMMKAMIDFSLRRKMKKIWLSTYADNRLTESFYKKFGFIREGAFLFDEYFGRIGRHVISMAKFLDPRTHRIAKRLKTVLLKD